MKNTKGLLTIIISILFLLSSAFSIGNIEPVLHHSLIDFDKKVVSGGPPPDGIPPIEDPIYISIAEAEDFMNSGDPIFVLESEEGIKAYPQKILVWHEIVNEFIDGKAVSITYCPLTGSAICYKGDLESGETNFGTSGKLVNSNLIMYDRETRSYWPQILGVAINGSEEGKLLEEIPIIWTTWDKLVNTYPEARVLSLDTGFFRSYGVDPYGSYQSERSYYNSGEPFFAVMAKDNRFESKEVVIGIKAGNSVAALSKTLVSEKGILNIEVGGKSIVAFYDKALDAVRVYSRELEEKILEFEMEDKTLKDSGSGSLWNIFGESIDGDHKGKKLEWITSFDVMWFAWYAFYPDTEVYE